MAGIRRWGPAIYNPMIYVAPLATFNEYQVYSIDLCYIRLVYMHTGERLQPSPGKGFFSLPLPLSPLSPSKQYCNFRTKGNFRKGPIKSIRYCAAFLLLPTEQNHAAGQENERTFGTQTHAPRSKSLFPFTVNNPMLVYIRRTRRKKMQRQRKRAFNFQ